MKAVAEYRQFAALCRDLADRLTNPRDKHATELMAGGWEKIANERELALKMGTNKRRVCRRNSSDSTTLLVNHRLRLCPRRRWLRDRSRSRCTAMEERRWPRP